MKIKFMFFLVCFLLANTAFAGWKACPGDQTDTGASVGSLSPGRPAQCYRFNGTTAPARISTGACANGFDVLFDSDVTTQGSNYDVEVQVYRCANLTTTSGVADCEKVLVDRTGDGLVDDTTMNGDPGSSRDATYNITGGYIAFTVTANPSSRVAEIRLHCRE